MSPPCVRVANPYLVKKNLDLHCLGMHPYKLSFKLFWPNGFRAECFKNMFGLY